MADRSPTRARELSSVWWALLASAAVATGCTNGSTNGATPQPTTGASADAAAQAQPAADTPRAPVAATTFETFPAVNLGDLSPYQKAAFTQLANEEICPCDCPKSWGACLQDGTK